MWYQTGSPKKGSIPVKYNQTFAVPRTNTRFGDRSFSNSGPKMWNSLPSALRQPGLSFAVFKQHLISYLFDAVWDRDASRQLLLWTRYKSFLCTYSQNFNAVQHSYMIVYWKLRKVKVDGNEETIKVNWDGVIVWLLWQWFRGERFAFCRSDRFRKQTETRNDAGHSGTLRCRHTNCYGHWYVLRTAVCWMKLLAAVSPSSECLYEGKADVVYLQVTLCDPHLSA